MKTARIPIRRAARFYSHGRLVLGYLLLPNFLFWMAAHAFDTLPRATIDIDYLVAGALAPFVGFWGSVALMSGAVLADVFRSSGSLYYFSQRDAFNALGFVDQLPTLRVFAVTTSALFLTVLWSTLLVKIGGSEKRLRGRTVGMTVTVVFLTSMAVWGGNSSVRFRDESTSDNVASSSGLSMVKTIYSAMRWREAPVDPHPIDSATRRAGWFDHLPADRNVVLVVVESWGHGKDSSWDTAVTSAFDDPGIAARYDVERGTVPFHGPTVPGEFRELCGLISGVIDRPTESTKLMEDCLPNRFVRSGTDSTFVHGFDAHMFDRASWVPKLGFEHELFRRELQQRGIRWCDGPFAGPCDDDVARWIGDQLTEQGDRHAFYYMLTLNSHLPVTKPDGIADPLHCGSAQAVVADEASCDLLTLIARVHTSFAAVAKRPGLPMTEFLLVGDHAPPFLYKWRREQFSQTDVPFIHLVPKTRHIQTAMSR